MPVDLLGRKIQVLGEDIEDVFVNDEPEFLGDSIVLVLVLQHVLDGRDGDEGFVPGRIGAFGIQDGGANDGGEIAEVHPRTGLLVLVRKGGDPFEKDEEDLHCVAVIPG
jgi:hypothetical protein